MALTNEISLAGLVADRSTLGASAAERFVAAQLDELIASGAWASGNRQRIPRWVANRIIDAATDEHPTPTGPGTWELPAPVTVRDVAGLVGPMFNVPPASAEQAVFTQLGVLQRHRSAAIRPHDLAARDVLQVMANLLRATRTHDAA